jgi:sRNA-binding carbon storage regulator CsrA
MLVLTRRPDESLVIEPAQGIDPAMTVGELFAAGPLVIEVLAIKGQQARIGIDAPAALAIVRDELLQE